MSEVEKHAAFYRGYLADDRNLLSFAGVLITAIALWLLFYLIGVVGPRQGERAPPPPQAAALESSRLRIPTKPATHSNRKPATDTDLKPAGVPI
jgi:hypothetical protein